MVLMWLWRQEWRVEVTDGIPQKAFISTPQNIATNESDALNK